MSGSCSMLCAEGEPCCVYMSITCKEKLYSATVIITPDQSSDML